MVVKQPAERATQPATAGGTIRGTGVIREGRPAKVITRGRESPVKGTVHTHMRRKELKATQPRNRGKKAANTGQAQKKNKTGECEQKEGQEEPEQKPRRVRPGKYESLAKQQE